MTSTTRTTTDEEIIYCQICLIKPQKYSCPRCNILYCSVNCYKSNKHSECSETFYKECIIEEIALQKKLNQTPMSGLGKKPTLPSVLSTNFQAQSLYPSNTLDDIPGVSTDIRRMYEILKRMESCESNGSTISDFDITDDEYENIDGDDDDEDDDEKTEIIDSDDDADVDDEDNDLAKRLNGVNLNDPNAIWDKLTETERQEFEKIIKTNDCTELIPMYKPWWEDKYEKNIQEINGSNNDSIKVENKTEEKEEQQPPSPPTKNSILSSELPKMYDKICDFKKLSPNKLPSDCVQFNLINVLAGYAVTLRYFNGDLYSNPYESYNYLLASCSNLKLNINFTNHFMAIERVVYDLCNEGFAPSTFIVDKTTTTATTNNNHNNDCLEQIKIDCNSIINCTESKINTSNIYILTALSDILTLLQTIKNNYKKSNAGSVDQQQKNDEQSARCSTKPSMPINGNSSKLKLEHLKNSLEFTKRFVDHKILNFNSTIDKTKLNGCIKKIEYYLSYVKSFK